jgi:hypothetical protein
VTTIPESTKIDTFTSQFKSFQDKGLQFKVLGTRLEKVSVKSALAWVKISLKGLDSGEKQFESLYGFRVMDDGSCGWEWAVADQEADALSN